MLISGCSSGIGSAPAREFASRGCRVFATSRKIYVIEPLKKGKMETAQLDVTDSDFIETCVREVIGKAGKTDVPVNSAGYIQMGPVRLSLERRSPIKAEVSSRVFLTMAVPLGSALGLIIGAEIAAKFGWRMSANGSCGA